MPTYDVSTDEGKVRLLISDVGGSDGRSFLFQDNEISAFLALRTTVKSAAALALRSIAGNEAQVAKRIVLLDLETDGPSVANALMRLADSFDRTDDDDADIDFATMNVNQYTDRELRGL